MRRWAAMAVLAGIAGGCAFTPQDRFVSTAYDYNLTIEQTQNQMLLVNIVRGAERRPMYFSSVTALRGALTTELGSSLALDFPTQSVRASGATPSFKFAANPTFDFVPLDSKNFTRGILTPVPLDTLVYYWHQGWPQELLLHMFVQAIEYKGTTYTNYPPNAGELKKFQDKLRTLLCAGSSKAEPPPAPLDRPECKLELTSEDEPLATPLGAITTVPLKEAIKLDAAGLKVVTVDGSLKLASKKKSSHIVGKVDEQCRSDRMRQEKGTDAEKAAAAKSFCTPKIFLRSPEAMLYYLGEILRLNIESSEKTGPMIYLCDGKTARIFQAEKDSSAPSFVSVVYDGHRYSVPIPKASDARGCDRTRSSDVFTLVNQLIGQNKDVADLPTTGAVTIVGPK